MMKLWWRVAFSAVALVAASQSLAQGQFPFDRELILDVAPMRGTKRIPNMDVAQNGGIVLEMWCNRIDGQFVVAGDTVTVLTGQATDRQCPPERVRGDSELLAALTDVTGWRWEGDMFVLVGRRPLRFRLPTN